MHSICCCIFSALGLEEEGEDLDLQLKLLTILNDPTVMVAASASGDVGTLRDFLTKNPSQVHNFIIYITT